MYLNIFALVVASVIFIIGFGKKVLYDFKLSSIKMLILIFLTLFFLLFPMYTFRNFNFYIAGIWLMLLGVALWFRIPGWKDKLYVIVGSAVLGVLFLLYRLYAYDAFENSAYNFLFPIVIGVSAYICGRNSLGIFLTCLFGVSVSMYIMPQFSQFDVTVYSVGGGLDIIIVASIVGILLKEAIDFTAYVLKRNRSFESMMESTEDFDEVKDNDKKDDRG